MNDILDRLNIVECISNIARNLFFILGNFIVSFGIRILGVLFTVNIVYEYLPYVGGDVIVKRY